MSEDLGKLTQDKELTQSIRDLTIGLSKFFNEVYPWEILKFIYSI